MLNLTASHQRKGTRRIPFSGKLSPAAIPALAQIRPIRWRVTTRMCGALRSWLP